MSVSGYETLDKWLRRSWTIGSTLLLDIHTLAMQNVLRHSVCIVGAILKHPFYREAEFAPTSNEN